MPQNYYGDGTIPSPVAPGTINIASSTNATPIVVTTATPHGYTNAADADTVEVEGHLVNTNANGVWQISVLSATTFALDGSVGNGVGGATGYVRNYAVSPAISEPVDGDLSQAAAWNPAVENLTNMAPFLYRRAGRYRLYDLYTAGLAPGSAGGSWSSTTLTTGSVVNLGTAQALLGGNGAFANYTPVLQGSDVLIATLTTSLTISYASTSTVALGLAISVAGSAYTATPLGAETWTLPGAGTLSPIGACFTGIYNLGGVGVFDFGMIGFLPLLTASDVVTLVSPWRLIVQHYRLN